MTLRRFSSRTHRLDQSFLAEQLKGALSYRRIAGYFTSSLFEVVHESLESIADVKIVCNVDIHPDDLKIAQLREAKLLGRWNANAIEAEALLNRDRYKRLDAFLQQHGQVIRVAPDSVCGFVHGKAGVIERADGRKIGFMGSMNETRSGWQQHYEILWEDDSPEGVAWIEAEFDFLWNAARPLPEAVCKEIRRRSHRHEILLEDVADDDNIAPAALIESPLYREGMSLQPWQQGFVTECLKHYRDYGYVRLLLADEVGLGKTLSLATAALALCLLNDREKRRRKPIIIFAPATLCEQWHRGIQKPPYDIKNALFVAFYASAELSCHLTLGWDLPEFVLDLYVEFRNLTNGLKTPCGSGLLGALSYYGIDSIDVVNKESIRQLAIRGGQYSEREKKALLAYCESDVDALARLFVKMLPNIDLPRALLRGRYMKAAARIERQAIPIDTLTFGRLRENWAAIQDSLIAEIDRNYGVYEGRTFKISRFADLLVKRGIDWPRLPSGVFDLQDDTFREMSRIHPEIALLKELRVSLSQMRLPELAVGEDGRNRCILSVFHARTGRNQPSNAQFIFGTAVWLRGLIKPKAGFGVAYIDWSQQEFGIAAALSGDLLMKAAYQSGDPYLSFAKQAGAVPSNATKKSHKLVRDQFKACVLAVQYCVGAESLAQRMGQPQVRARELLRLHKETYRVFWAWSDSVVDYAMLHGKLWTAFGWMIHVDSDPNPLFLRNFLMQSNGAEMLRLACCMITEAGISLCAPIHDAILIEAPLEELDQAIAKAKALMAEASSIVLNGFELHSDVEVIRYPNRYNDLRGSKIWQIISAILSNLGRPTCADTHIDLRADATQPAHLCPDVASYYLI